MASSVNNVSSSNTNSLYGNRNVLSGLSSGMDTEGMIENAVSGIKTKITDLQKQRTSSEWKQEAYRSVIEKMVGFQNKYASYTSGTNLLSPNFFDQAVTTTTNGTNAAKISATGKTTSTVAINSVTQLAASARYAVNSGFLIGAGSTDAPSITAGSSINLATEMDISKLSGSMTLRYGSKSVSINFDELALFNGNDGKADLGKLKSAIQEKLGNQQIVTSSGNVVKANTLIGVDVTDGKFTFTDLKNAGNSVYISDATGQLKDTLNLVTGGDNKPGSFTVGSTADLTASVQTKDYLAGKKLSIDLDGVTKEITLPKADDAASFVSQLQASINSAFGTLTDGTNKLTVGKQDGEGGSFKLSFSTQKGSTMQISSSVGTTLGISKYATSYVNTASTLGDLKRAGGTSLLQDDVALKNDDGSLKTDAKGNKLYSFELNGVKVGEYTKDTTLETVLVDMRNNTEAGVNVSFSKITNQFVFSAKETGADGQISFDSPLAKAMFGSTKDGSGNNVPTFQAGKDAIFSTTINGGEPMNLTRSTNTINLDGLSVTLKDTFTAATDAEKVTFSTKSDSDKIVSAVKDMVKSYNEMVTEIKSQYSTIPAKTSSKKRYQPLTEEDKTSMSESAVTAYEKKAKQGLLFGDRDLSTLYDNMHSAITPSGADGSILRSIGIGTNYSQGLTTLSLDENKLRSALESNPEQVKDAFTKTKGTGSSGTDGLMQALKTPLDRYSAITGSTKGILVEKAGTALSPLSLLKNSLQDSMDTIDDQIDRWETKLSDQVDLYTSKFTQLEKLISQMNSQSSALTSMLGS